MSAAAYVPRRVLEAARAAGFIRDDGSPDVAAYLTNSKDRIAPKTVRVPRYSPPRTPHPKKSSFRNIHTRRQKSTKITINPRRKRIVVSPQSRSRSLSLSRSRNKAAINEEHPKHVDPFNHVSTYRNKKARSVIPAEHIQTIRRKLLERLLVERIALTMNVADTEILTELSAKPKLSDEDEQRIRKELNRIHSINISSD